MTSITFSFRYLMNYKVQLTTTCTAVIYFFLSKLHKTGLLWLHLRKKIPVEIYTQAAECSQVWFFLEACPQRELADVLAKWEVEL